MDAPTTPTPSFVTVDYDGTLIETKKDDGLDGRVVNTLQVQFFDIYDTEEKFSKQFKFWNPVEDHKPRLLVVKQNARPKTDVPLYEGLPGHCMTVRQLANGDVEAYDSGNWFSEPNAVQRIPDLIAQIKELAGPKGRCFRMEYLTIQSDNHSCAIHSLWYVILLFFGEEPWKYDMSSEGMFQYMTLLNRSTRPSGTNRFLPTSELPMTKDVIMKLITNTKVVMEDVYF